jgi:catechol 2,3-dioxygenase-like lactoylglutathione lyase family enzyme
MLNRFGVISVWVQDLAGALSFYRDTLGLPSSNVHPGEGYEPGADWARFELQGTALELFSLSRSPKRAARTPYPRQNSIVPCFLVDDFDAEYRALEARGVAFYLVGEQEWGRYAHFRDPEGNELQIYQPKPSAQI